MNKETSFPWPSPLSASTVAVAQAARRELQCFKGEHYLLERRPKEQGRTALLLCQQAGVRELLPSKHSVRCRIHEYGGGSYLVTEAAIFFIEETDQQIYSLDTDGSVRQITHSSGDRFGDLCEQSSMGRLICVREQHDSETVRNELVTVSIDSGEVSVLVSGDDFYASPSLNGATDELAYISWSHPNMPWHNNKLWRLRLADSVTSSAKPTLVGREASSKSQPRWSGDGSLYFLDDISGWWNIWCQSTSHRAPEAIAPIDADLGRAQWELGMSSYVVSDNNTICAIASRRGEERLLALYRDSDQWRDLRVPQTQLAYLRTSGDNCFSFIAASPKSTAAVLRVGGESIETVLAAAELSMRADGVSVAESIMFTARDGSAAQGFFYAPCNPQVRATGELPPLIVVMHGGPTTACGNSFNSLIQFWTSRGVAVFDINYRGSTGFGRAYRMALQDSWGIADVEDCVDGVSALVQTGRVDGRRVAIRGGSAGGFTALAAAVESEVFAAVGCHYGIADLELLARDTHKFESHYLEHLIGAYPLQQQRYVERSPIHHLHRIQCPIFISHGQLDQVVPVNQAQHMAAALQARGVAVEKLIFEDERHGYAQEANIAIQLQREFDFFLRAFENSVKSAL